MKYYLGNQPEKKDGETVETGKEEIIASETAAETAEATEGTDAEYAKAMKVKRHFLREDIGKRESNAKHYIGNDGTVTAVYSNRAVHYTDGQGETLKEVDNSLSDTGDALTTKANAFKTRFRKRSADGEIFEMTKDNCKVGLKSCDLARNCNCESDNCTCEETNVAESRLLFKDVKENVDLQYTVDSDRVKENIIVKTRGENYEYDFDLNIENLEVGVSEDGKTLQLKDKESGEVKFYIPAPFMVDFAGAKSDLVYYEIAEQSGNTLNLKVVADNDWINAEERVFPVIIDPQIVYSDSSMFTYKYYEYVEKQHSSGLIQYWEETEMVESIASIDSTHKMILTINKSGFTMPMKSVVSVKLQIYSIYGYNCSVNGVERFFNPWDEIDVTDLFKTSASQIQLEFTNNGGLVNVFRLNDNYAPKLLVEYVENDIEPENKRFTFAGKVSGEMNAATGVLSTAFKDVTAGNSALPLQIAHVHLKSDNDFNCGDDWRLNLHQTLEKSGEDYFYTDSVGQKHTINEVYYYVKDSVRTVIEKANVTVEQSGLLTYTESGKTYEVTRELRTNSGLRLATRLDGVNNVQYIEQRQDEEKQLEQYIESYRGVLNDLQIVRLDMTTGSKLNYSTPESFEAFIREVESNTRASIMSYDEYLEFWSLHLSRNTNEHNQASTENSSNYAGDAAGWENYYEYRLNNTINKRGEKIEQVKEVYKEYLIKLEEQKQLKRQLPVSYIVNDDSGRVLCFNADGKLCAVTDRYENYIAVEWGEIATDGGTKEVITSVYEGENKTSFEYDYAGRLKAIAAHTGARADYTYTENGALQSAVFADGSMLRFDYTTNGEVSLVRSNDHTLSKLTYATNGYALKTITDQSTVTAVTDASTPVTQSAMLNSASGSTVSLKTITYGTNYTSIAADGATEYILFDGNKKLLGNYVNDNGRIDDLTLYTRSERLYQFAVKLKKTADMLNTASSTDSEITNSLGKPLPTISSLPGITSEYSSYGEADWESVTLDQFSRPKSSKTNWRFAGTSSAGKNIFVYTETVWTYAADNPSYPCVKKTTTVYTNINGLQGTSGAEKKVYAEKYSYCDHGNLVKTESYVEGEEGTRGISVTEKVCDDKGNIIKEFSYNTLDSSTKFYTENEYAENGNVTARIDETGENKTMLEYAEGTTNVKTQVLPNKSKFSYGYDASGNVTAITQSTEEGEENSTNVKYSLNCPTRLTSGNNLVYYEYDRKRRITKVTVNGTETSYAYAGSTYDSTASVTSPSVTIGGVTFAAKTAEKATATRGAYAWEQYTDKQGNVVYTRIGTAVQSAYNYNTDGTVSASGDKVTNSVKSYTYQAKTKKPTKVAISAGTNVSALTESYTYNDHGELGNKTLTGAVNQAYGYFYKNNAARDIEYITLPNALRAYPTSDVNGRNTGKEITDENGNKKYGEYITYRKVGDHATNMPATVYYGMLQSGKYVIGDNLKYKYDSCGNIIEITENGALSARYEYDSLNRIVREDNKKLGKTHLFSYDSCGNITSRREFTFTLRATEKLEELTELLTVQYGYEGDRLTSYGGTAIVYDTYGNPTSYKGNALTWQYGKRLTKYGATTFTYDGYGRRTKKGSVVFTYDANGNLVKQSDGTNKLEFVYDGNGLSGFNCNGTNYLYRKNAQGDVTHILDTSGMVVAKYVYDAWGNHAVLDSNGNDAQSGVGILNPFRYRGYYYDSETDLYFLQTRYYDPEVGRFISQDDVSYLNPDSINGLNLYAYCGNNPVMFTDPNGTAKWWQWLLFGIGAALVVAAAVVLMVASGGAATGLIGAIAVGAAKGALIGAAVGSAVGIAGGAIYAGATGADMGQSILSGFLMGFGIGAIVGAVIGGTIGGLAYTPSGLSRSAINKGIKALNSNDLHHIMSKSEHALNKVLSKVTEKNVKNLIKKTLIRGVVEGTNPLKVVLSMATGNPTVTGMIVGGIVRIGTFFIA